MQKTEKEQSITSMASERDFERDIDTPVFDRAQKPKKSKAMNVRIEAYKRAEKTKFEDLRN